MFAQETYRIDIDSSTLNNFVADKNGELNFHFVMGMIKNQGLKRYKKDSLLSTSSKKQESPSRKSPGKPKKKSSLIFDEESDLISEKEFISAVKGIKNLYRKMFPRTLVFREVLLTEKVEEEFNINKLLHKNGRPARQAAVNFEDDAMYNYDSPVKVRDMNS